MSSLDLFPRDNVAGVFRGFSHGGLEFHADIVLPYRDSFHSEPMHGQFLLVQLANEDEAVLGRVASMSSDGRLASSEGEDFGLRAVAEGRPIPEDLREQYVKYRVNLRVLGVLRRTKEGTSERLVFAPSHRRLPHVGSKVAFLSEGVLREVAAHNVIGADLGFLAFGEFIYAGEDKRLTAEPWMRVKSPHIVPKFPIDQLVSRRSFVFARAGFGKSNLVKLLFANLYKTIPTTEERGGRRAPVGTVIFDPEGEYFWPDKKGRPGLCDVPELQDKIVVFTSREAPSPFYGSFVAGDIKLDIRRMKPSDVVSIALSPERQEQQNVRKLKGLNSADWETLVNAIDADGNGTDLGLIKKVLRLEGDAEAEAVAARSNMTVIVRMLHDRGSRLMDMLMEALRAGRLCIVDVSQLRGGPALILTGLILQRIFDANQEEFTKREPRTIPTIAVLEEAQSVLGQDPHLTEGPYVTWVKEGRKYDLGAVLITQQPGSIRHELLSQGDNWFVFHLLSAGDLTAVQKANAHYSEDLLSSLLNEPIAGHCVFWSSSGGKPYPLPLRAMSFESQTTVRDPKYNQPAAETFAASLLSDFQRELAEARNGAGGVEYVISSGEAEIRDSGRPHGPKDESPDVMAIMRERAIEQLRRDEAFLARVRSQGMPWRGVMEALGQHFPQHVDDRDKELYRLVPFALDEIFGAGMWRTEQRQSKTRSGMTTWVVLGERSSKE